MSPLPSYVVSKADAALITRLAERAVSLAERHGRRAELLGVCADLTACHANGCRLDLGALLEADDAAFVHDVRGIGRHLDRVTGALRGFGPRFAMRKGAAGAGSAKRTRGAGKGTRNGSRMRTAKGAAARKTGKGAAA